MSYYLLCLNFILVGRISITSKFNFQPTISPLFKTPPVVISSPSTHISNYSHHRNYSNCPHHPQVGPDIQSTEWKKSDLTGIRSPVTLHATTHGYRACLSQVLGSTSSMLCFIIILKRNFKMNDINILN